MQLMHMAVFSSQYPAQQLFPSGGYRSPQFMGAGFRRPLFLSRALLLEALEVRMASGGEAAGKMRALWPYMIFSFLSLYIAAQNRESRKQICRSC